jgi:hypothetical protein
MLRFAQLAVSVGLMALLLSACGIAAKPLAGSPHLSKRSDHDLVDNPYTGQVQCLRQDHVKFRTYLTGPQKLRSIQVRQRPQGPTLIFEPTPGAAQILQIEGHAQGAEIIGEALVYPNRTKDKLLTKVEHCATVDK